MPVDTIATLIDALRTSQVLDERQLAHVEGEAPNKYEEPRALARDLIAKGWLTRYQARQILQGRGAQLQIGSYRLLERLGSGGMGQVYKALHVAMNRVVALKIVRPELVADARTLKRFRREVQAAGKLSHPNIVTVFDASQEGEIHFLAMEYIDGVDLSVMVRESGPLPIATACDYARQAALGLHHAHERGMIHRDVKPGNILITRSPPGIVKILDMGLARPTAIEGPAGNKTSALTMDGVVVGTPDFMAPEQAKNSHSVDQRADLYSLGCTLYFMLTGRLPFPTGNVMEKLIQHQLEQPYPAEMVRKDIPPALLRILHKMMAKERQERYQSGQEIALALEPFSSDSPAASTMVMDAIPVTAEPGLDERTPPPANASSPFRFDEVPPLAEVASPKAKRGGSQVSLILAGAGVLIVFGVIVLAGLLAAFRSNRKENSEPQAAPVTRTAPAATAPARTEPAKPPVVAEPADRVLSAAIPDGAGVVAVFHVGQMLNSAAIHNHFGQILQPHIDNLSALGVDPARQFERLIVSIIPGETERSLLLLDGAYMNNEVRTYLTTAFKLEPRRLDADTEIPMAIVTTEKGKKQFVAILQDSFLAIANDLALLRNADQRLRDPKLGLGNPRLVKLLATGKNSPAIRFAVLGSYFINDQPLEIDGIREISGSIHVTDKVELDALALVRDPKAFREKMRAIASAMTTAALFDVRHALIAALLRNPAAEIQPASTADFSTVTVTNTVQPRELAIILKAMIKRMGLQ